MEEGENQLLNVVHVPCCVHSSVTTPLNICKVKIFFFGGGGFRDRVSLYSPGCPGAHFVDQAGLELRNPPASASRVLGLKACDTTPDFMKSLELSVVISTFRELQVQIFPSVLRTSTLNVHVRAIPGSTVLFTVS
jgi:hypothetical protein